MPYISPTHTTSILLHAFVEDWRVIAARRYKEGRARARRRHEGRFTAGLGFCGRCPAYRLRFCYDLMI